MGKILSQKQSSSAASVRDWIWSIQKDREQLARRAARHILLAARSAIAGYGEFHFVATGGETVRRIYNLLAESGPEADWNAWHVYLTDERCAPDGDALRNSTMLSADLLERTGIPQAQVHLMHTEHGAAIAAADYAREVGAVSAFDLVLLGLGEDGHIASLFPGGDAGDGLVVAVFDSPKPPSERVSLAPAMLTRGRETLLVASGERKREALAGIGDSNSLFRRALGEGTRVTVIADEDAAAGKVRRPRGQILNGVVN